MNRMNRLLNILKGGQGSGNFGHSGRPGEVGGSSEEAGHGRVVGHKGLTEKDVHVIRSYSDSKAFTYVNGYLRNDAALSVDELKKGRVLVNKMDQAFKNSSDKAEEERTVYRGMSLDRLPGGNPVDVVGQEVPVDSYMSVSTQRSVANGFPQKKEAKDRIRLEIKVPQGTRYINVMRHSGYPEENELLFHRGSRLKITGSTEMKIIPPAWVLTAELIPSSLSKSSEIIGTDWFDDDWLHYPPYRSRTTKKK